MNNDNLKKQQIETALIFDHMASDYTESVKASNYIGPGWLLNQFIHNNTGSVKILDLGCGDGINAKNLLKKYNNLNFTGLDISAEMIFASTKANIYEALYHQSLDSPLSFAHDNEFDQIITLGCLEFVSEIDLCLSEISRVLKKMGHCYLTFQAYDLNDPLAPRQTRSGDLIHFAYSEKEIFTKLNHVNLEIISIDKKIAYNANYPCPYFFIIATKK